MAAAFEDAVAVPLGVYCHANVCPVCGSNVEQLCRRVLDPQYPTVKDEWWPINKVHRARIPERK